MNYFAHGLRFIDKPYFLAGTAVPDWLSVVDRRLRLRAHHSLPGGGDPIAEEVAGGVAQHLKDDAIFHNNEAFTHATSELTSLVREALGIQGHRTAFIGHLLLEMLLDAALILERPVRLDDYYQSLDSIDALQVERAVNLFAPRPTDRLASFIDSFTKARVLWDYLQDDTLIKRLNQVMQRLQLEQLPLRFMDSLPQARELVSKRRHELMAGIEEKSETIASAANA